MTDVIIDHLKRKPDPTATQIFHNIKVGSLLAHVTSISVFELYCGARLAPEPMKKLEEIRAILHYIKCLSFDETAANVASEICVFLEKRGELIEVRDLFIGAFAKSIGLTLVTKSVIHFKKIPYLEVITPQNLLKRLQ